MNRSLGCLTPTGIISAVITAALITIAGMASGQGIFSPGELNAQPGNEPIGGVYAHADLFRDCAACHTAFWSGDLMGERCLDCHASTRAQLSDEAAFHFGFANPSNCRGCHTDHHGPDGPLTYAAIEGFPHERTGYSLKAHEAISEGGSFMCGECHTVPLGSFDEEACRECHESYDGAYLKQHIRDFYPTCLGCHDGVDTFGHAFDHDAMAFQLVGEHDLMACRECHAGARDIAMLRATDDECVDCHLEQDIHTNRISQDCGKCHTPATWAEASFPHLLTGFDLLASHEFVDCETCHVDRQWVGIPRDCAGCHLEQDVHDGQFDVDCAACHIPSEWADHIFDHSRSKFLLTGAHIDTACTDCHPGGLYVGTPTDCVSCHQADDRHGGQFGGDCSACHTTNRWSEITFDHQLSRFPLTGAHRNTPCLDCHGGGSFIGTPVACFRCHSEPSFHAGLFGLDCALCHSTSAWRPASYNGPHSFPMNHGGAGGTCSTCHPNGYTSYTCFACHEHNQSEINKKHQEEGIGNFSNCVRCHANGRKEEGDDD
jgi:endogenous inhibitor of DNA gyrase (YacG/DUF329 family)